MPRRAKRPCTSPGCPELVASGYCTEHARQYEQARGTRQQRGYGREHEQWRAAVLARDPICTYCKSAPSTDADHIQPKRDRPDLEYDVTNGRGACNPCHMRHGEKASRPAPRYQTRHIPEPPVFG